MQDNQHNAAGLGKPARSRSPRISTLLIAECERRDGSRLSVKVRNISATGMKGECGPVPFLGAEEEVLVHFPNLTPISGRIVRYVKPALGVSFAEPVDLDEINRARKERPLSGASPRSESMQRWIERSERERAAFAALYGVSGKRRV